MATPSRVPVPPVITVLPDETYRLTVPPLLTIEPLRIPPEDTVKTSPELTTIPDMVAPDITDRLNIAPFSKVTPPTLVVPLL